MLAKPQAILLRYLSVKGLEYILHPLCPEGVVTSIHGGQRELGSTFMARLSSGSIERWKTSQPYL